MAFRINRLDDDLDTIEVLSSYGIKVGEIIFMGSSMGFKPEPFYNNASIGLTASALKDITSLVEMEDRALHRRHPDWFI